MERYVILLRGVMPTGRNSVPMAPLRAALRAAGLHDIVSYIQSGNIVARSDLAQGALEQLVHQLIQREFGGELTIVARTASQFHMIFQRNPYPEIDRKRIYFTLLAERAVPERIEALQARDIAPDELQLIDGVIYLRYATQLSHSPVNNNALERWLKVAATTRNYNTMEKLVHLSTEH